MLSHSNEHILNLSICLVSWWDRKRSTHRNAYMKLCSFQSVPIRIISLHSIYFNSQDFSISVWIGSIWFWIVLCARLAFNSSLTHFSLRLNSIPVYIYINIYILFLFCFSFVDQFIIFIEIDFDLRTKQITNEFTLLIVGWCESFRLQERSN